MKEEFILIRSHSDGGNYIERVIGTRDQVREYFMKMITEDADEYRDDLEDGTENVDDIEFASSNGMYGYNYFAELTMQFYCAIIHILDGIALSNLNLTPELESALDIILMQTGYDIQDIADANDCEYDDNTTWNDMVNEFKRLWREGERV